MKNRFRFNFVFCFKLGWFYASIGRTPHQGFYRTFITHKFGPFCLIRFGDYIIPILYKREFIGGNIISRAEAMRGLPTDAECEATRAEFKRRRGNSPLHLVNGKITLKPK